MVNWVSDESWSWSSTSFSWLCARWFWSILITNSKRFSSGIKWFINMILSWIRCHFVLFPFISLSFNFFIWRNRMGNACAILNLRTYGIKASSSIISSRTWTSIGWLRILNTRWKKNGRFVFLSKYNILFHIFSKCRFVPEILSRCLWRTINHSLLFPVFNKSEISRITIFISLLARWSRISLIVIPCFRNGWLSRSVMGEYIFLVRSCDASVLRSNEILFGNNPAGGFFVYLLSFFKILFSYFLILNWFCDILMIHIVFGIIKTLMTWCLTHIVSIKCSFRL